MSKLSILVVLLFLGAIGFFAIENTDSINIKVPLGDNYIVSKFAVILLSSTAGAFAIFIIFFIRDSKKAISDHQYQKKQKKEAKVQEYYSRALSAISRYKHEEARDALKDVLKVDPLHVESLLRLGDIAVGHEDYKTALEYYKKAKETNPVNLQVLFSIAAVFEKMDQYDDEMKYIDAILDAAPDSLAALYRKRDILEHQGKWDKLMPIHNSIINRLADDRKKIVEQQKIPGFKYEYAMASLQSGEQEQAINTLKELLKLVPDFIPAYVSLADILYQKGKTAEAINLLEEGYERANSLVLIGRLEDLLIKTGEQDRLIRFYRNAISSNPRKYELKFLLGKVYSRLGMVDDSLEILNSLENVISSPEFYILRGELYLRMNQQSKALEELKKAYEVHQSSKPVYCCLKCGSKSHEWAGRCIKCQRWNAYSPETHGTCKS